MNEEQKIKLEELKTQMQDIAIYFYSDILIICSSEDLFIIK